MVVLYSDYYLVNGDVEDALEATPMDAYVCSKERQVRSAC